MLLKELLLWGVFIIIPLLWEILTGLASGLLVLHKAGGKTPPQTEYHPSVTVIIPACRSEATLKKCVESVLGQDYPKERIEIYVVDNGSTDSSSEILYKLQAEHPSSNIRRYSSSAGKSKALNKGIFSSSSKYIINIDSDGWLDKNAVKRVVEKFERDAAITCMTGVVLTDPALIEATGSKSLKLLRLCEFIEYTETFLVGRNFQSVTNTMFTISGAFSCFRSEAIKKTQLYNSDTVGEDAHMTFQIRSFAGGRIVLCEDAYFYAEPIKSFDALYSQRQRWQRGQLETAALFKSYSIGRFGDFFNKFAMRTIISDHTLAFPRLIWMIAVFYLFLENYPLRLLIGANLLLYGAYLINSLVYFRAASAYLKNEGNAGAYHRKKLHICLIMPAYRFLLYWMRVAGIVNCLGPVSGWNPGSLTGELGAVKKAIRAGLPVRYMDYLNRFLNRE